MLRLELARMELKMRRTLQKPEMGKKPEGKKKQDRGLDAFEQMEIQRKAESRQRIVERFLRLILVGDVDGAKEERKKKGSKSSGSEGFSVKSIKEKANTYGGPAIMFAFIVAMLAIRAAEEGYHPADHDEHEFNYYEVMGLSKGLDVSRCPTSPI
eukprot:symbB.v1.2.033714.t1/scaffold4175.1/size43496/4